MKGEGSGKGISGPKLPPTYHVFEADQRHQPADGRLAKVCEVCNGRGRFISSVTGQFDSWSLVPGCVMYLSVGRFSLMHWLVVLEDADLLTVKKKNSRVVLAVPPLSVNSDMT